MIDRSKRELLASAALLSAAARTAESAPDARPFFPQVSAEMDAGVPLADLQYSPLDVRRYGAVPDGATDCAAAINSAIAVAVAHAQCGTAGGEVVLPAGVLLCRSDVRVRDNVTLRGHYNGTELKFDGCGLKIDATGAKRPDIESRNLVGWSLENIRIRRTGASGYAVECVTSGGSADSRNRDCARFSVRNLYIVESTGGGIHVTGTYLGSWYNTFIRRCSGTGLLVEKQSGRNRTALNASGFFGGEIQACGTAASLARCIGVGFYAFAFEGCAGGVDVSGGKGLTFDTCYFEVNGGSFDIRVGDAENPAPQAMRIVGCHFIGDRRKPCAIELVRANRIAIESCNFQNYAKAAIHRNAAGGRSVSGGFRNCVADGTTPSICGDENTSFHQDPLETVITAAAGWHPGSVAHGASVAASFTVAGARSGDFVMISPGGGLEDLCLSAYVAGDDEVRVILTNNTGSRVTPPERTWRIVVWKATPAWF